MAEQHFVPENELGILKQASEVKTIADDAEKYAQEAAVAKEINMNANTGAYSVTINYPLMQEVIDDLETSGYAVTPTGKVRPADQYRIDWIG